MPPKITASKSRLSVTPSIIKDLLKAYTVEPQLSEPRGTRGGQ